MDANTARLAHLTTGSVGVNTPLTLQDEWMEQVIKIMPREAFQTPLRPPQPNSLALAEDTSNVAHLSVPAPRTSAETAVWRKRFLPLDCDIAPHVQPNGRIEARVKITGTNAIAVEARVSVWDSAPVMLAIPASRLFSGEPRESMFVLYVHLYLDNPPPQEMFNGVIPKEWRAQKGAPGGALSGEIVTGKGAFGIGKATLNVRRGDQVGSGSKNQASLVVGLDSLGRFNLPNLAAGHYQVELGEVRPYQSAAIAPCSFEEYLQRHLGIRQAAVNVGAQEAEVRAGDRAQLPPWIFNSAK